MKAVKRTHKLKTRRAIRTRATMFGTKERPRLSVFRSAKHISAQVINDETGTTIAAVSDAHVKGEGKPVDVAKLVGMEIAKKAMAAGVNKVVFDRGAFKYHGRVKALADGAREGGLDF